MATPRPHFTLASTPMPTIHIFADESGNFDFGKSGTDHYTFAVVWTTDPRPIATALSEIRFEELRNGNDITSFHCANDNRTLRKRVFEKIAEADGWGFCAVVIKKERVYSQFRRDRVFYPMFLSYPLKFVLRSPQVGSASRILIFTDRVPVNSKRRSTEKAIQQSIAAELGRSKPYHIYHHPSESNPWLQVVDYCCWAVHRKHEFDDDSYYSIIRHRMAQSELVLWKS